MKKFLLTITTIFLGISIYAKDLNQLLAEYPANGTKGQKYVYTKTNKEDLAVAFDSFKNSAIALVPYKANATKEEKDNANKLYSLFNTWYVQFWGDTNDVPDLVSLRLSAWVYCVKLDKYNELKKNGWKIGIVSIKKNQILAAALEVKDFDTVMSIIPMSGDAVDICWPSIKKVVLREATTDKGIQILNLCETEMLMKGLKTNLEECQNIKKALTMRKLAN